MAKYFTNVLIYFHEPEASVKPESEISSHITLTSIKSGVFHSRYLH